MTALPRDVGFAQITELAARNSVPYAVTPVHAGVAVNLDLHVQALDGVSLYEVSAGNYRATRSERLVSAGSEPRLVIQASNHHIVTEQNGFRARGARGSLVSMWSLSPLRTEIQGTATIGAIDLPLLDVGLPHRMLRDLMGRDLGASPMGRVVTAYVRELARTELSAAERAAAAVPTRDLVRALLALAAGDESRGRGPLSQTMGTRIMMYARAHLSDPDLTADRIAARFNISRRYLYVILDRLGVSLGEWMRTERLARAASDLADPSQRTIPVGTIARRNGFRDHSTFSRAFRAHHGCAPSDWRGFHLTHPDSE